LQELYAKDPAPVPAIVADIGSAVQVFFRDRMLPHFLKTKNKRSLAWLCDYAIDWQETV